MGLDAEADAELEGLAEDGLVRGGEGGEGGRDGLDDLAQPQARQRDSVHAEGDVPPNALIPLTET
eukprot:468692-Hanusia_phi.AAC.1